MAVYWKLIKPGDNANWVGMLEDKYDLMSKMVMKPTKTLTKTRDNKGSGGNEGTRGERRGAGVPGGARARLYLRGGGPVAAVTPMCVGPQGAPNCLGMPLCCVGTRSPR